MKASDQDGNDDMTHFLLMHRSGETEPAPTDPGMLSNALHALVAELDALAGPEEPDVEVIEDISGVSLAAYPDGAVSMEYADDESRPPRHVRATSRLAVVALFERFITEGPDALESESWLEGYGA